MMNTSQPPLLARSKIVDPSQMSILVRESQAAGQTVAMCLGCFDILHAGHVRHLEAASAEADLLVVIVTADRFVNKGPDRPVFPEGQRAEVLAALACVDLVSVNAWDGAVEIIRLIRPDVFVKGEEYEHHAAEVNPNFLSEAAAIQEYGGRVAFTRELTLSSTATVARVRREDPHE